MRKTLLSLFTLFLLAPSLSSLPPGDRDISLWDQGGQVICQTQVWDIATDTGDPYRVFLASNDGLCIYAGHRWEYVRPQGNPIIRALKYDRGSGRLYSAGVNGFGYWLPDGYGSFSYTPLFVNDDFRSFSIDFWRIAFYRQKVIFQCREALYIYDLTTGSIDTLPALSAFRYIYESGGRVWYQDGNTLGVFSPEFDRNDYGHVPDRVINVFQRGEDVVAAIEREGLVILEKGGDYSDLCADTNTILAADKITCCKQTASGNYLVGTTKGGLFSLDENGGILEHFPLGGNAILGVSADENANVWVGFNSGAAFIDNSAPYRYIEDDRLGQVHCFSRFGTSGFVAGTNKGVFRYDWDGSVHVLEQFSGPTWGFSTVNDVVYVLHDVGVMPLDADEKAVPVPGSHGTYTLCPLPGETGHYVAGTYTGLDLFQAGEDGRLHFQNTIDGYRGYTRNIAVDEYGAIWVAIADDGFVCLGLSEDKKHVSRREDCVLDASKGKVFFTTIDGQLVLVGGMKAYRPLPEGGLTEAPAFDLLLQLCGPGTTGIVQDGNRFWYISEEGVGFVKREGSAMNLFSGLLGNSADLGKRGGLSVMDGMAFLGFRNGIGICGVDEPHKAGPLHILSALAIGPQETRRFRLSDKVFEVPADMNTVQISLAGLPADRRIEYRVSSVSDRWVPVMIDDCLQLNSLQSGLHGIEMRLPGSSDSCRLFLRVRLPWYLTLPMLALYLLLVAGSILAAIRIVQLRGLKKQEQLQKELDYLQMKNTLLEKERKLATHALLGVPADEDLERYFNEIYNGFTDRLKRDYPMLSKTDLKMCIFEKMNLSNKEIASRMNISAKGVEVAKYRLRKKLALPKETSLQDFVASLG